MRPVNDNSSGDAAPVLVSAFQLSRIFAQGWNAARKLSTEKSDKLTQRSSAVLNPYASEPQRSRWAKGFAKALEE